MTTGVTQKDLPWLGALLYRECERVRSGGITVDWSPLEAHEFIGRIWNHPEYHLEVRRQGGVIQAVCGVTLVRPVLPPHPLTCVEWLWWGQTPRETAAVLASCKVWGRTQHAEYFQYALALPQRNARKFIEQYQWVRL